MTGSRRLMEAMHRTKRGTDKAAGRIPEANRFAACSPSAGSQITRIPLKQGGKPESAVFGGGRSETPGKDQNDGFAIDEGTGGGRSAPDGLQTLNNDTAWLSPQKETVRRRRISSS